MLDDSLVLDRKLGTGQVDRENTHNSVTETSHFDLNDQEVETLRKIAQAKKVLIRFTGQKGYVGVDQEMTGVFVNGVAKILPMHDALTKAVSKVGSVSDAACPS